MHLWVIHFQKIQKAKSLYDSVKTYGPQCIRCVDIPKQQDGRLDFSMTTDGDGHVIIEQVSDDLKTKLHIGDR